MRGTFLDTCGGHRYVDIRNSLWFLQTVTLKACWYQICAFLSPSEICESMWRLDIYRYLWWQTPLWISRPPNPLWVSKPPGPLWISRPPNFWWISRPPNPLWISRPPNPLWISRPPNFLWISRPQTPCGYLGRQTLCGYLGHQFLCRSMHACGGERFIGPCRGLWYESLRYCDQLWVILCGGLSLEESYVLCQIFEILHVDTKVTKDLTN